MINEMERAQNAFERYVALGESRSLKELSRRYRYGIRSVERWSAKFNWTGKLADRLVESEHLAQKQAIESIAKQRSQYIIGIHNALVNFFQKVTNREIVAEDFDDMDKLLKNLRLEMGQPTAYTRGDQVVLGEMQVTQNTEDHLFERAARISPELRKRLECTFDDLLGIEREIIDAEEAVNGR